MAITYLSGQRIQGLSSDTKPTDLPLGSQFEETDTFKIYQHLDAWVTTAGTLSGAVYLPAGKGDKTDGWTTTGSQTGGGFRNELDWWNGTTWADKGTDITIDLDASAGAGTSSSITVAGSASGGDVDGCSHWDNSSWTTKANRTVGSGYSFAGGTASAMMSGGGVNGDEYSTSYSYDLSGDSWSSEGALPSNASDDGLASCAGDGTAVNTMFIAGGRSTDYSDSASTAEYDGSSWSSSPADLSLATSACVGGGNKTGFWKMGGQPTADRGKVSYYNGTSWTSKPDTVLAFAGSGGANNGGTNPLVSGGKSMPVNGNWTAGQYFGTDWVHRGST